MIPRLQASFFTAYEYWLDDWPADAQERTVQLLQTMPTLVVLIFVARFDSLKHGMALRVAFC